MSVSNDTANCQKFAISTLAIFQAGDVQKAHEQNEVLRKKLDECKTIEKVLKESTNQVPKID